MTESGITLCWNKPDPTSRFSKCPQGPTEHHLHMNWCQEAVLVFLDISTQELLDELPLSFVLLLLMCLSNVASLREGGLWDSSLSSPWIPAFWINLLSFPPIPVSESLAHQGLAAEPESRNTRETWFGHSCVSVWVSYSTIPNLLHRLQKPQRMVLELNSHETLSSWYMGNTTCVLLFLEDQDGNTELLPRKQLWK